MAVALITITANEDGGLDGAMKRNSFQFKSLRKTLLPASCVLTMIVIGGPGSTVTA